MRSLNIIKRRDNGDYLVEDNSGDREWRKRYKAKSKKYKIGNIVRIYKDKSGRWRREYNNKDDNKGLDLIKAEILERYKTKNGYYWNYGTKVLILEGKNWYKKVCVN